MNKEQILNDLINRVEKEINKTPSGETRNLLSDVNIFLQTERLNFLSSENAKKELKESLLKAIKILYENE